MNENGRSGFYMKAAGIVAVVIALILVFSTWWTGRSASLATDEAVRSISMFYLDELTGRREQVVSTNLQDSIKDMQVAVGLMTPEDLSDVEHLQAYQAKMKQLYGLEKFAFVDTNGLIYTSLGPQYDIDEYKFDYQSIAGPEISVKDVNSADKRVVIAMPIDNLKLGDETLVVCFMEMTMQNLVDGLSLQSDANETTYCNIYTRDGVALTDMVLGGLASEDNLLDAMQHATYESGYSFENVVSDFAEGRPGVVSFTYNGIKETLDYVPVEGTDWMLTYLIRESVIAEQVSDIADGVVMRNILQTVATALILLAVFVAMLAQTRRNAQLALEAETFKTESRVKQQEMEQRLALQEQLLEQEKSRAQQDKMITALASDYRGVYYVDLDTDNCICYQTNKRGGGTARAGDAFAFNEAFAGYAQNYVDEAYRDGFLEFIKPDSIREGLESQPVISYRYLVKRGGNEEYEALRMAGVRHAEDRDDHIVHAVGVSFVDVDRETRDSMAKSQALSDALNVAQDANKAKTAFLSSMSHEIRTPMNAIIGLDSIALSDPNLSDKTRENLEKIGDSAQHLLGLINDILDVSRIESGRMTIKNERFSFSKVLEQVNTIIGGQCNDKGLEYSCQINGQVDDYYIGDDVKLRQTLINILGNAVKFTEPGGNVDFTVERIAQYEGRSTLRFTMSDTGIGMDESFLPRIFDTFSQEDSSHTNRYGSTGLGMAITKSIVEMMNGTIDVASKKGEGTTFTVTVTLLDAEQIDDDSDVEIDPSKLSVLVVDDDPVACEHAKLVLEAVGISSEIAFSGQEAVKMVQLRHARRNPFNLILLDWKMPEMDGVETARQIRATIGDESAIIILTAYNWDDVIEEALSAGVDSFLAKPLFAANVLEEFRESLKKKGLLASKQAHRADLSGRRMLLAEDMPINAEIIKEIMKMREVEIDHAENGLIAVEKFADHPEGYYDAVLMDMRMPEMDGLTATVTIRAMDRADAKSIPIIALTANAFDEDVQQSLQAGLNAHLSKPIDPEVLFETLEGLVKD